MANRLARLEPEGRPTAVCRRKTRPVPELDSKRPLGKDALYLGAKRSRAGHGPDTNAKRARVRLRPGRCLRSQAVGFRADEQRRSRAWVSRNRASFAHGQGCLFAVVAAAFAFALPASRWTFADDYAGLERVKEWREQVWRNAERLVDAKSDADRAEVASQIQQFGAGWARTIANPLQLPGYRAQRDAYCRKAGQ
jgi:hypothetical protein